MVLYNVWVITIPSLCEHEVRIGNHLYNSFAYADDVSLFSTTVPGLEKND